MSFTLFFDPPISEAFQRGLAPLRQRLTHAAVNTAIQRPIQQLVKDHLYRLANERHNPRSGLNFYADAADSVSSATTPDGLHIRIDKTGIAQRIHGGDIEPVNKSHLWIPAAGSQAQGKAPGEFWPFDSIVFSKAGKGSGFAVKDGEILFWLVNHVHQDPDPTVLPSQPEFQEAAERGLALLTAESPSASASESREPIA